MSAWLDDDLYSVFLFFVLFLLSSEKYSLDMYTLKNVRYVDGA